MEIVKNQTDELSATIQLNFAKEDYEKQFLNALKNYSKQVNIPGFRKGMVPLGMVKKMAGKAILADEIQKMVSDKLFSYIEEQKINILGNPLPLSDNSLDLNVNDLQPVKMEFEIGLKPDIKIDFSNSNLKYKAFQPDSNYITSIIEDYQLRAGDLEEVPTSEKDDLIEGVFVECTENGDIIENGHQHQTTIHFADLKSDELVAKFIGLKAGNQLVFNIG